MEKKRMKTDRIAPKLNRIEPNVRKFQLAGRQKRLKFQIVLFIALGLSFFGLENAKQSYADSSGQTGDATAKPQAIINKQSLFDSALNGDMIAVQAALGEGIDVNATDQDGRTALMFAGYNGHTDIVRLLLDSGARVDRQDSVGRTALMYAASGPYPQTVQVLLSNKADPNIADKQESWTALMFAAAEGQTEIVQILLNHGADKTLKDADGETALDFARNNKHGDAAMLLK